MSKQFFAVILIILVALGGLFWWSGQKKADAPARLGVEHADQGNRHINPGETHEPYNSDLPSSGSHYPQPAPWGVYAEEIPPEVFVHNLEHGGMVVTYRFDIAPDQLNSLKALLFSPHSRQNFSPTKVLLFPRAANTKPVQMATWTRTLDLDSYDEETVVQFYLTNAGKSPEPNVP